MSKPEAPAVLVPSSVALTGRRAPAGQRRPVFGSRVAVSVGPPLSTNRALTVGRLSALTVGLAAACSSPAPESSAPFSTSTVASDSPVSAASSSNAPAPKRSPSSASSAAFDEDPAGAAPRGFEFARTGAGAQGAWRVIADANAPSAPNVLAQLDTDATNGRFPVAVTAASFGPDVRVAVRCKMVSGKVDRACGLVARYRDDGNYYVTRANALEGNVRLYKVEGGRRKEFASFEGPVQSDTWHSLELRIQGDVLEVHWNGQKVLSHRDATFPDRGRVGVWTKADSVTHFDDLSVEALP
jgi:hypothetical protein